MNRRKFGRAVLGAIMVVAALGVSGCEELDVPARYGPYDYLYYWDTNVYFHPHSQLYFYVSQRRWIRSRRPPPGLSRRWTRLVIRDGAPYHRNHEHRSWYRRDRARQYDPWDRRDRYDRYGRDRYDRPTRRPQPQPPSQQPRDTFDKRPGEEWRDYHERKARENRGARPQQPPSQPPRQPRPDAPTNTFDKRPGEDWRDYHERKERERRGEGQAVPNWRRVLGTDSR